MPKNCRILQLVVISLIMILVQCKPKQPVAIQTNSFREIPDNTRNAVFTDNPKDTANNDYFDRDYTRSNDHIYRDKIKTVLLHPSEAPLSPPVLLLNDNKKFKLSFDDLEGGRKEFTYKIIHCNADWQASELLKTDYIEGFTNDLIRNSSSSEGTYMAYTNYTYYFPNEYFSLTKSGNYLFHVYYHNELVLTKRFMIAEMRVGISTDLKEPTLIQDKGYKQELDFIIQHPAYEILDPYQSLKVFLLQNNRWDNMVSGIQPNFVKNGELVYNHDEINVFEGGNEYRNFDLKNLKFSPSSIAEIRLEKDKYMHAYLTDDEPRSYLRYSTSSDINGKFLVKKDDATNSDVEADYLYVHFNLPYSFPESNGDIYIFGQLTDWELKDDFKMIYDYEKKSYTKTLLLKQGYYNYNYAYLEDYKKTGELSVVEGTHFETENDYSIRVYYRQPGENYDRFIGVKNLNSVKKN